MCKICNFFADFFLTSAYLGPFKMILQQDIIPFPSNILAKFRGNLTNGFDFYELIHNILHVPTWKTEKYDSSIFWFHKIYI